MQRYSSIPKSGIPLESTKNSLLRVLGPSVVPSRRTNIFQYSSALYSSFPKKCHAVTSNSLLELEYSTLNLVGQLRHRQICPFCVEAVIWACSAGDGGRNVFGLATPRRRLSGNAVDIAWVRSGPLGTCLFVCRLSGGGDVVVLRCAQI